MATLVIEHGSDSNVGRVREHNEDAWETVSYSGGDLLIVCDGMGGHEAGDVASAVASRTIAATIVGAGFSDPRAQIFRALERAHQEVLTAASAVPGHAGMGTTAVVGLVRAGALFLGHVGDSRAYLVRDGVVSQLTRDQTKVQELVDNGLIAETDAKHHPDAGVLAQAIGMPRGLLPFVTPEETGIPLRGGDLIVLCSDGVYDAFDAREITPLTANRSARDAARTLVKVAVERDGQDNATAVVAVAREAPESRGVAPTVIGGPAEPGGPGRSGRPRTITDRGSFLPVPRPPLTTAAWIALLALFVVVAFVAGRATAGRNAAPARPLPSASGNAKGTGGSRAVTVTRTETEPTP
ncbi:MAG: serine/threonine-protein phosphatase [Polyangiaceae bacterium]|nr:serine/threonine-protein phosphatase [Polyangiaceae bacterium]